MAKNAGIPQDIAMQIADDANLPDGAYFAMVEELIGGELGVPLPSEHSYEQRKRDTVAIDTAAAELVVALREQSKLLASYIPGSRYPSHVVGYCRKRTKAINKAADAFARAVTEASSEYDD